MSEDHGNDQFALFTGIEDADPAAFDDVVLEKRPRGLLSHADREFLLGEREYEHPQTAANRRQEIRERVVHAFADFPLLWIYLPESERTKIFSEELPERDLQLFLESMLVFLYQGIEHDTERFEELIESAVYLGENTGKLGRWVGEATDVDVSIDIEYNPDLDRLEKRLEQGDGATLTPSEIGVLVRAGKLSPEDLEALEDPQGKDPGGLKGLLMRGVADNEEVEL